MNHPKNVVDRAQLQQRLQALLVPPTAYSLNGGHPSEAYVLDQRDDRWVTYYSERGLETGTRTFDSEPEACAHLLERITRDLGAEDATNTDISPETRH